RDDPPVGDSVIDDSRVAIVVSLATTAEPAPKRLDRHRAVEKGAALIINGEVGVHCLDVMVGTDVAVRIRWRRVNRETRDSISDRSEERRVGKECSQRRGGAAYRKCA